MTARRRGPARDTAGKFRPGSSGNPTGRPPLSATIHGFMEQVVSSRSKAPLSRRLSLLEALFAVAMNPRARDRFRALELLLAYDFGRPRERVEMSGPRGGPIETGKARRMTTGEMRKELEAIEQRRRGRMATRAGTASPERTGVVELTDEGGVAVVTSEDPS